MYLLLRQVKNITDRCILFETGYGYHVFPVNYIIYFLIHEMDFSRQPGIKSYVTVNSITLPGKSTIHWEEHAFDDGVTSIQFAWIEDVYFVRDSALQDIFCSFMMLIHFRKDVSSKHSLRIGKTKIEVKKRQPFVYDNCCKSI